MDSLGIKPQNLDWNHYFAVGKEIIIQELKQTGIGFLYGIKDFFGSLKSIPKELKKQKTSFEFLAIVLVLLFFGLMMCFSAGFNSVEFLRQLKITGVSLIIMFIMIFLPINFYREVSNIFMLVCFGFMVVLAVLGKRFIFGIQPSDYAKLATIMFFSYLMEKYKNYNKTTTSFLVFAGITLLYCILIFRESHLSCAIIFLLIGATMLWLSNQNRAWFYVCLALGFIAILILFFAAEKIPFLKTYQIERVVTWRKILFNKELTFAELQSDARQVLQSLYGISTGGLTGVGINNSAQKFGNLDEAQNDFIFAIIAEELGFVGSVIIIAAFALYIVIGFSIAANSRTIYGSLVVGGICMQIAFQVLFNIGVAISLLPNTGIGLPFFSEGGSSMMSILMESGIILAVARDQRKVKSEA